MCLTRASCMAALSYCCMLLLLLWCSDALPSPHALLDGEGDANVLTHVLDAERNAVARQLELYKSKAGLLKALLSQYEDEQAQNSDAAATTPSRSEAQTRRAAQFQQSRQRAYRQQQQQQHSVSQRFSDWFDPQGSFYPPVPLSSPGAPGASQLRLDLFSFRSNASPSSKKSHNGQRGSRKQVVTNHLDTLASLPLLQFLTVFDMDRGRLDLYSPTTKQLVWQHELLASTPIADYFFASERLSYLVTVSVDGNVSLYKLRVLHNRRLLSGDHRIPSKFDRPVCMRSSRQLQTSKAVMGTPLNLPWRASANTLPAANHLHINFELVFHTKTFRNNSARAEKVAVVTFYSHSYVITTDSAGELAFFHGENGSFISSLATDWFAGDSASITQFHVLTTGIVAAAVGNRIHFVNPGDQTLVGVTCDGAAMGETITSVDSDPWRYSTLYAGTSRGRVLVFQLLNSDRLRRTRNRQPPQSREKNGVNENLEYGEESEPACVLVDQLRLKPSAFSSRGAQVQARHRTGVRAIPGYVVMTTNSEIVLFQASYEGVPTYVTAYPTRALEVPIISQDASAASRGFDQFVALLAAKDPHAHPTALAVHVLESFSDHDTSRLRLRVDMYESLLPQPTSSLDLGWLRVPIMLLCAVAVMYWQQQGNGNSPHSQIDLSMFSPGTGVGPGAQVPYRSKNDDFDIARLAKMAQVTRNPPPHHCV